MGAPLINAFKISKEFAGRRLFNEISFGIESRERIGLIGPNGAGKSTLLKILSGREVPDEGRVSRQNGLKVAYLEQVPTFPEAATIFSVVSSALNPALEDWEKDVKSLEILSRLHLEQANLDPTVPIARLSGGWKKRVAIARAWAEDPDLLLLDEPTNHLDVESILWLEDILLEAPYAYVVITHDRLFLQRVTNRILELDRRNPEGLLSIAGGYADYLQAKESLMSGQLQQEADLKNKLRRETEWLRRGPKARTTKQKARIERAYELSDVVEEVAERNKKREMGLNFKAVEGGPKKLIEAIGISKSLAGRTLFQDVSLTLTRGSRIGLLGPNGSGKSTLIKTLLGDLNPDSGLVKRADHIQVSYFEQNRSVLNLNESLLKSICPQGDHVKFQGNYVHIRSYLDRFLFSTDQADMPLRKLSGGEQARVLIARLMLQEANLLVLDEPTNDLDVATLDLLQEQLETFEGAILLVSHDRYFLDQVCTELYSFENAKLERFADLFQWEEHVRNREKQSAKAELVVEVPKASPSAKKKLSYNEQRELAGMEASIEKAEERVSELTALVQQGKLSALEQKKAFEDLAKAQTEVERLYARWSELSET